MSLNPDSDPIVGLDRVGNPGIGIATSGLSIGSRWQMGIAVPLKNRKFEYGTVISYKMSPDPFDRTVFEIPDSQLGVTAPKQDLTTWPSNVVQYGDKALLGPSSLQAFENFKESIRLTGARENFDNPATWSNGVLYSLDRRNKFSFSSGDSVTIFGSGIASAWEVDRAHLMTAGIKKGYRSLNRHGLYSPRDSNDISLEDNSLSTSKITLRILMPSDPVHNVNKQTGPGGGPSVFNSVFNLGPWRDSEFFDQNNNWDWILQGTARGVFRYIQRNTPDAIVAYESNVNSQTLNIATGTPKLSLMTGFYHMGGQLKDTAQALFSMVSSTSETDGSTSVSEGRFKQVLTSSINDAKDLSHSHLVSGTHYRLGLTWRGNLNPGGANSVGSHLWAKFQWGPLAVANQMISTPPLLDSANSNRNSWTHNMVSGFVGTVDTDYLDPDNNLKIELVTKTSSPSTYVASREGRGSEMLAFIDNIWLEHQGDIPGASDRGYIEIDHFPEQGTLTVNETESTQTINLKLSDGSSRPIDPTGNLYKKLYVIEGDFLRVRQDVYEQLRRLLEWQKRGYRLTLHPFLPEVPHCLVGRLDLERVSKNHWDLTRFNFRFRFTETE